VIAALALLALLQQAPSSPATAAPAPSAAASGVDRAGTVSLRVSPEAPSIGEPITIEIRVRAPRGTLLRFPTLPDTGTRIEPLDPRTIQDASTATEVDQTATYRLIAWDTGSVSVAFGDVTLERDGRATRYPVRAAALRIQSLLPRDTAARRPREAREPLDEPTMPWRWLVAAAVVAALAAVGMRRARRAMAAQAPVDPGALVRARAAFAHLQALDLAAAGEAGRHLLAHVGVLRRYLGERWPELPPALTSGELAARLAGSDFPVLPDRLTAVLDASEAVAYAGAPIGPDAALAHSAAAVALVEDLERAWLARQSRERESARVKRKKLR
jgi:hypothetical protein